MAKRYDSLLRLILVGDSTVGKTCMICQYASNEYHANHITTLGVDFKMKIIKLDGRHVKMQIWDTAGQERFEAITKQFYTRAQGVILVYDITCRSSFESIAKWLLYVKQYANDGAVVILIGNKNDLHAKRQVYKATAEQFALENGLKFYEASAKEILSLQQPFEDVCRHILEIQEMSQPSTDNGDAINLTSSNKISDFKSTNNEKKKRGCSC